MTLWEKQKEKHSFSVLTAAATRIVSVVTNSRLLEASVLTTVAARIVSIMTYSWLVDVSNTKICF